MCKNLLTVDAHAYVRDSLHEPQVKCFSKGKEHKKFEFGSKGSLLTTQTTGVIVGAMNFTENVHDSKTLPTALEQYQRLTGKEAKEVYLDRGYPGVNRIGNTQIHIPKPNKNITKSQRKKHKRRAAIEPVIGHLKQNYRLGRNFLKGSFGDSVNLMLAAAAMNFKRMMNKWKASKVSLAQFLNCFFKFIFRQIIFKFV
jgi:IS5 family transposase